MSERKFRIAYAPGMRQLLGVLGCGPRFSGVLVDEEAVRVRLGWAFQATVPRSAIASADPDDRPVFCLGVHGWRSTWLVNGSPRHLVRIQLSVGVHARVLGWKVPLTTLFVSVEDRDELIRLIRPAGPANGARKTSRARRIRLPSPVMKPGLARDARVMHTPSRPTVSH
ncbi:hypothetical protein [Kineosporia babensis]|uniref:Uncharacterized protein n=1 Tax=Kineosporia babensis TaxID=499548 RepID=A0A9X1NCV4_9ACTN|nr:hypothetical protein [Kineosporia babensis]MCD5311431.1 hypothetical protein [Kineosporia babensis]